MLGASLLVCCLGPAQFTFSISTYTARDISQVALVVLLIPEFWPGGQKQ